MREAEEDDEISNVRTIFSSDFRREGDELIYEVRGNGFLHHMVRNLVGTLVEIGKWERPAESFTEILEKKSRSAAGRDGSSQRALPGERGILMAMNMATDSKLAAPVLVSTNPATGEAVGTYDVLHRRRGPRRGRSRAPCATRMGGAGCAQADGDRSAISQAPEPTHARSCGVDHPRSGQTCAGSDRRRGAGGAGRRRVLRAHAVRVFCATNQCRTPIPR